MILNAAVSEPPRRSARCSFTYKPVFNLESVIGKLSIVVERAKFISKTIILIVANTEDTILYAKGVSKIFSQFIPGDFHDPSVEVFTIENAHPFFRCPCL